MKLGKRKITGREKDEESIRLLEKLREKLYSEDSSIARQAAFHLSWMQEDGMEILKEAVFGNALRKTKSAAAYGMRNMHGRMKQIVLEALGQGLAQDDADIKWVCSNALSLLTRKSKPQRFKRRPRAKKVRFRITEIPDSDARRQGARRRSPNTRHSYR
ncbi:MAG: hypothetical protein JXB29_13295 [Sedimentisphaerales bacterium]|nr:hypothetical protein [Sedimentisphaerales bacterium]